MLYDEHKKKMSRRCQRITSATWLTFLNWSSTPKPQALTVTNLSQITCSAFYKQTNEYGLILRIAQTWLLPNNQSDAQEFDECITPANQKMSYLMDVSHQPIRGQVIFEYHTSQSGLVYL
jgi:hypothetical protein